VVTLKAIDGVNRIEEFINSAYLRGLVQVVASDAHTLKNRGFAMTKAYQVLNDMDSQYPESFAINARDLLNGEQIDSGKVLVPRKQKKFWLF